MSERPDVVSIIRTIAEGGTVDWSPVDQGALDESMLGIVRELQVVAQIADVHATAPPTTTVAALEREVRSGLGTWGRLTLMEHVGRGTFGDVYRAWDGTLDREVALKVLRAACSTAEGAASAVLQEGRLLARVRHPNVVTIYGADCIDDQVGLWMEFIEGPTLEERLRAHGSFDVREAAAIGVELCGALAAVHDAGFVHGDVKTHNVMLDDTGRVVLMDFGAGRDVRTDEGGATLAGTALYLAPEVLAGRAATVLSEIYSLGVLLYRLVAGAYPVEGQTLADIRGAHAAGRTTPLGQRRPDLPDAFVRTVDRALSRNPDQRFRSATEMKRALASSCGPSRSASKRALIGAAAVLLVVTASVAATHLLWRTLAAGRALPPVTSMAILPFENRSGGADQYLVDGVADEIGRQLGQIRNVRILARQAAASAAGEDPLAIGQRLHVDALMSGTITKWGDRLDAAVQVKDTRSGKPIAGVHYTGSLRDLGSANGLAASIVGDIHDRLWPTTPIAGMVERPQTAYLTYLRGRSRLTAHTETSLREAATLFEQAIRDEPSFAEAYAGLADAHTLVGIFGFGNRHDEFQKAKAVAMEAIRLDDRLTEAHTSLAFVRELADHDWAAAEAEFRRAIAVNPSYSQAHHWYAMLLDSSLRHTEALQEIRAALSLDPLSAAVSTDVGTVLSHQRRYGDAIAHLRSTIVEHPTFANAHKELAWAYGLSGQVEQSIAEFTRTRELGGLQADEILAVMGCVYAMNGDRANAQAMAQRLRNGHANARAEVEPFLAPIYLALGETDAALEIALRALPEGDVNILVGASWDPVRHDPRYRELVRRTGLLDVARAASHAH